MNAMQALILQGFFGLEGLTPEAITQALVGNLSLLAIAILLIIATILIIVFIKQIIINSVLGIIAWVIVVFVFHIQLNFWVSLIVSIIFGLAGIGVLLILAFFGIIV